LTALSCALPIGVSAIGFEAVSRSSGRVWPLLASGSIVGLGIVAMHYTGMAAIRFPGELKYDGFSVLASVAIAVCAATAALWIAALNTRAGQKVAAAVLMGIAIAGMHYSAMHGLTLRMDESAMGPSGALRAPGLAGWVAGVTLVLLLLATTAAAVDRSLADRSDGEAEKLRASEERFRLLLNSVTDYAIFMLDEHGNVANWNTGAERIKGYSSEEVVGMHFSRFYPEEDRASGLPVRALRDAAETGRFEHEGWRLRKDGSRFWAHVVIDPMRDDAGGLRGYVKITRDITERKRAAEMLDQARDALFQAQKMEAVGQLTGGVAHDFNNLLMAVLGSLELLRKRLPDDPRAHRLLENAVRGAQRGSALTQRMLAFARKQELKLEAVDVVDLVRGMGDLFERSIGPQVRIATTFPMRLAPALADPHQLEVALLNLVVNARDAMPAGGSITIAASDDDAGRPAGLPDGKYVCLSVDDTGVGMDPETLARAQEPFFTTKGVGKGTGLGLPMVRGVAEQSGGCLRVSSEAGKGTRAEIWLRVSDVAARKSAPEPEARPEDARERKLAVLVVDDDPLVLDNAAAMLDDLGHAVTEARSGEEALSILEASPGFDLIVSDQAMPGMTGLGLLAHVRASGRQTPFILASGYAELPEQGPSDALRLAKPFDQNSLARAIDASLRFASGNVVVLSSARQA
jgi:PAS domain S-box-containing protein